MTFSKEKEKLMHRVLEYIEDVVRSKKEIIILDDEDEEFHQKVYDMPNIVTTDKHGVMYVPYSIIKLTHDSEKPYGVVLHGYESGEAGTEKDFELGELDSDNLCMLADLIFEKYA